MHKEFAGRQAGGHELKAVKLPETGKEGSVGPAESTTVTKGLDTGQSNIYFFG